MCGISGLANCGDRETLARMNAAQAHRGPNDSGLWQHRSPDGSYFGLGSRRLSILDLSPDGHMPMSNEDGTVWLTFNGEIYNYRSLRRMLEACGHHFRSDTAQALILQQAETLGAEAPPQLAVGIAEVVRQAEESHLPGVPCLREDDAKVLGATPLRSRALPPSVLALARANDHIEGGKRADEQRWREPGSVRQ